MAEALVAHEGRDGHNILYDEHNIRVYWRIWMSCDGNCAHEKSRVEDIAEVAGSDAARTLMTDAWGAGGELRCPAALW